jgi:solute carrier family 25 uncoupling protein 27
MKIFLVSISCSIAEIVTHPIDTIKTKLQLSSNKQLLEVIQQSYKENGWKGFYKSIYPALGRHWIYSTGRVTIYEQLKQENENILIKIRNGCIAGGFSQLVASPMDLIKIRLQGNPSLKMYNIIRETYSKDRLSGFYKGWQPNVARAALVNIGELVAYDYSKKFLLGNGFKDNVYTHFLSSIYSGFCSTVLSTPADVVKSNYMNNPQKYKNSLVKCISSIYQENGIFYFWRGSLLNWIRLGPWQMIFWTSYENLAIMTKNKTF